MTDFTLGSSQQLPPSYPTQPGFGTPGKIRPTAISIVIFFATLGIYLYVYNYLVHNEMKRFSGRGVGGGIALLLTFLGQVAMPFVTPAEVGSLYTYWGQRPPVNGWTGLWHLLSLIGGNVMIIIIVVLLSITSTNSNNHLTLAGYVIAIGGGLACAAVLVGGPITWFVKTNNALNNFWQAMGVTAR